MSERAPNADARVVPAPLRVRHPNGFWGASVGAIVAYALAALGILPGAPVFFPRVGAWSTAGIPGEPSVRWYGWLVVALVGAIAGAALARLVRRPLPWRLVPLIASAALLILAAHERTWFAR